MEGRERFPFGMRIRGRVAKKFLLKNKLEGRGKRRLKTPFKN